MFREYRQVHHKILQKRFLLIILIEFGRITYQFERFLQRRRTRRLEQQLADRARGSTREAFLKVLYPYRMNPAVLINTDRQFNIIQLLSNKYGLIKNDARFE